jgi:Dolichyl-phosphate-mannose-protein mannosyltransferase
VRKSLAPAALLAFTLLVLRLPSLVEPAWSADEGTYADIGYALAHGAHLYVNVWDNKPPGVYWLAELMVTHLPAVFGFEMLAFLCAVIVTFCTWQIGTQWAGRRVGLAAGVCTAVLISAPNLSGDLFNAEPAGAATVCIAVLLLVRPVRRRRLSLVGAGVALGIAVLFKGVFVADVAAVAAMVTIMRRAPVRPSRWSDYWWLGAGFLALLTIAAIMLMRTGSLGPALSVVMSSDTSYVAKADFGSARGSGTLLFIFTGTRLLTPLVAAAVAVWRMTPRRTGAACTAVWLGFDLAGVMLSANGFPHYLQQAEAPLCLAAAMVAGALWRRRMRLYGVLALLLLPPVSVLIGWIPRVQTAVAGHAPLPHIQYNALAVQQIPSYYVYGYESLFSAGASPRFESLFPANLAKQRAAVALFSKHSRPGQPVYVWGSIHWAYVLSDRVPAGRYVTLNSAYYLTKANEAILLHDIFRNPPAVIIIDAPPPQVVFDFLEQHHYSYLRHAIAGEDYWLAPGQP